MSYADELKKKYSTQSVPQVKNTPDVNFANQLKQKYGGNTISRQSEVSIPEAKLSLNSPEKYQIENGLNALGQNLKDYETYGLGNINLKERPIVKNADGSYSTVRSMSFNDNGKEILVPTVINGKVVSDDEAIEHYYQTGEYLGKFNTIEEANKYAEDLHLKQEKMYREKIEQHTAQTNPKAEISLNLPEKYQNLPRTPQELNINSMPNAQIKDSSQGIWGGIGKVARYEDIPMSLEEEIEAPFKKIGSTTSKLLKMPEQMKDNLKRFEDGYNVGDITGTALETVGDLATSTAASAAELGTRVAKGVLSVPENIARAGASIIAGGADLLGADKYANNVRRNVATLSPLTGWLEKPNEWLNKYSYTGSTLDSASEAVGQSAGQLAVSSAINATGASSEVPIKFGKHILNMPLTAVVTGMGSSAQEAYSKTDIDNATWKEKVQNALHIVGGGAIEGVSEGLFGLWGVGGSDITNEWLNKAVSSAKTSFGKVLNSILISGGSEAAEEFISYAGNYLWNNGIVNNLGEIDYSQDWNWEEIMNDMASAFISTGLSGGGSSVYQINKALNNAINFAEKTIGRELTQEEKQEIRTQISDNILKTSKGNETKSEQRDKITDQIQKLTQNPQNAMQTAQQNQKQQNSLNTVQNSLSNDQLSSVRQSANAIQEANGLKIPENTISTLETIQNKRPGLTIEFDKNIQGNGVYTLNEDGTRNIKINPNSNRTIEFTLVHELGHDLKAGDADSYAELQNFVIDFAKTKKGFEIAKKALGETYAKQLGDGNFNLNDEATNDILGETIGNQEFLNSLAQKKPNVFQRIYNWFKDVLFDGGNTGKTFEERRVLNSIQSKFKTAYDMVFNNHGNNGQQYSIQTDENGNKYVKVDTDQDIFAGIEPKDYNKIAKMYMQDYLKGKTLLSENDTVNVGNKGINKYTNPKQQTVYLNEKMQLSTELKNVLNVAEKVSEGKPSKDTSKFPSWEYYKIKFEINGKVFEGVVNIGIDKNGNKHFYEINKIRATSHSHISASQSSNTDFINNSIPPTNSAVNNQYMQNSGNNAQNSNKSSFSNSNDKWQKFLDDNFNLMPNATRTMGERMQQQIADDVDTLYMRPKKNVKLEDVANLTKRDVEMPDGKYKALVDKNTNNGRKFFENVETSNIISNQIKESVNPTTYEQKKNLDTLTKVQEKLDSEGNSLITEWFGKDIKKATDEDVALGAVLIERYQQQGDYKSAVNVVQKLADIGTEAGRTVQMYSIFQRLQPDTMMLFQQKKLNNAFEELSKKKTGEWVEKNRDNFKLTEDDAQFITAKVQEAQNAPTERQKQIALGEIESRINDKLPPEAGQSIKAFRRIAMLFNPKTQIRNVVGNAIIAPVNYVSDLVATQIDKAIAKKTGIRTTNYMNLKNSAKGFAKGFTEAVDDYRRGVRTEYSGNKYELNPGAKSFNENTDSKVVNVINKRLNSIDNLLSAVLSGGDRPFYEAWFKNSLEGQMKANNVTVPTQEMIDIASNEALSRTWNDSNNYTKAVLKVRTGMNELISINGFGLGDLIIPFAKTPANLTKAMVEYSPLGAINSLINYNDMRKAISRGEMTAQQQKKFVNSVGKTIAGTILYAIAGMLVKSGKITGSADDDKDVANFEKNVLGIQPYSIKIGDRTYTYSWANPINSPLAITADTYKMSKENAELSEILLNAFKVGGDTLVENSFLQGIKELFEADSISEALVESVLGMGSQFTPTILSQVANMGDDVKRQTYENGDMKQSAINEIKNKVPGLKNTLAPQVNTFGEEVKNYGGDNNFFNVFLSPANVSETVATDTQKELYALYEATKDKTIFPRQAPYSVSGGGESKKLSSEERAEYQKLSGNYVSENLGALFDSEFYKSLENEEKVTLVNKIVGDADTTAKDKWIDTKATEDLAKLKEELGDIPLVDYYNAWLAQKDITSDKNWQGKTISGSKAKKQIEAINNAVDSDLTSEQKKRLYGIFNISGYNK